MDYHFARPRLPKHAHEHHSGNRRARRRHARLAPSHPRASGDGLRGAGDRCVRRRQAALVRPRRAHRPGRDRRCRRAAKRNIDGAVGLRADLDALHIHESLRRAAPVAGSRQDARLRPRRPYDDAARRGEGDDRAQALRRHRVFHLPASRGKRRRRPRDGRARLVRPLRDERRLRHAQLAANAGRQDRDFARAR